MTQKPQTVSAAILVIGDEILSGRTKDKNIGYIADMLTQVGVDLKEARVVSDDEHCIVEALNALRARYDYVFTTGGIGPTHDDITADCVAMAFGVSIDEHPEALELLRGRYGDLELTQARRRMARIPDGAQLIKNKMTVAPGFWIGNVIVMAGVPSIMQVMLDEVLPHLQTGQKMLSISVATGLREGDLSEPLRQLAESYDDVTFGSYPFYDGVRFDTSLVARSRDENALKRAEQDLLNLVEMVRGA